jgi:hypothetical protein
MPFGEMILSSGSSTERDEPFLNDDDDEEYEHWNKKANTRSNSVNDKSIFMWNNLNVMKLY